jgi:hypothetical protein
MKNKYQKLLLSLLIISANFLPFGQIKDVSAENNNKLIRNMGTGVIDWGAKIIKVKGRGAPPNTGGESQKRLKARLAARMDAYRNIAELINGVQVTSETTVGNLAVKSDTIKLKIDALVKGARQLGQEKYLPDGSVEVEFYLPLYSKGSNKIHITVDTDTNDVEVTTSGGWSLANALDLGNMVKSTTTIQSSLPNQVASLKDFALPREKTKNIRISAANSSTVTGLIVDATGLGVEPALSPFIVGGGKIIYAGGRIDIDPEEIVKYGVTDYTNSMDAARKDVQRIGNSPLVIEATGATGKPGRTNILLDDLTLKNLLDANNKYNFLDKLGVVIVI